MRAALHLYESGDYPHALFFGHLYLEKVLKALIVQETESHSPYGHDLLHLARRAKLPLKGEQEDDFDRISKHHINCRYPEDLEEMQRRYTKKYCQNELEKIRGLAAWLKSKMKS